MKTSKNFEDLQKGDLFFISNNEEYKNIPIEDFKFMHPLEVFEMEAADNKGNFKFCGSRKKLNINDEFNLSKKSFFVILQPSDFGILLNKKFFKTEVPREVTMQLEKKYFKNS